jgi:integrase
MWQRKARQEQERARLEAVRAMQSTQPKNEFTPPVPETEAVVQSPKADRATTRRKPKRDRLDPRKVRIGGKLFWQVDLGSEIQNGRRKRLRRTFASCQEAETFSKLKKVERANRGTLGVTLSERLRGEAIEADQLLAPYEVSILDVVREYISRREQLLKSETVSNAFKSYMSAKADDGLRARTIEDIRYRVGHFNSDFGERRIADIAASEIDGWLRGLHHSPSSRNAFYLRLNAFFGYCRQHDWCQVNPVAELSKVKVVSGPPGILTPEQVARLLEAASEETLPFFALGAFAGLRSAEIERLEWHHIKWDERLIEVPATSSKTASRRFVTIQPNLAAWLDPYRGQVGPICPPNHFRRMIEDRRAAGITDWPSNALRHSFASYYLAAFKDAPALSLELGHTRPQTVFAHYRELVRPAEAEKFWKIAPLIDAEHKLAIVA